MKVAQEGLYILERLETRKFSHCIRIKNIDGVMEKLWKLDFSLSCASKSFGYKSNTLLMFQRLRILTPSRSEINCFHQKMSTRSPYLPSFQFLHQILMICTMEILLSRKLSSFHLHCEEAARKYFLFYGISCLCCICIVWKQFLPEVQSMMPVNSE